MNTQPSPAEDPLEVLLRKEHAPLADDGFSTRVLSALPPVVPTPRRSPTRRTLACSLGALTGFVVALSQSGLPPANASTAFVVTLQASTLRAVHWLSDPAVILLGLLTLASLALAYAREIAAKLDR
jgi:hypothetical protein